jgi:dipeptidyl aminopeptidase/acylaminoacyl peptidase
LETLPPGARLPSFLIMHGARDPYIGAEQSRRLYRALAHFGGSPRLELDVLPKGTHGGGDFERPETMARVVAFLKDCFE